MCNEIQCPECKKEMKILPQREPIETTTGSSVTPNNMFPITYTTQSYSPTSKTFKCSNPECWVTKLDLSWS